MHTSHALALHKFTLYSSDTGNKDTKSSKD